MSLIPDKNAAKLKGRAQSPTTKSAIELVDNNLSELKEYVSGSNLAVKPNHFLVKLLMSLPQRHDLAGYEVSYTMYTFANKLAGAHGLCHLTEIGKPIINGVLKGDYEYYIVVDTPFDSSVNWRELNAIEFLYHERTDIQYRLDGTMEGEAIAFLSINIGILSWQLMRWGEYVVQNGLDENIYEFIHKHVISGTMRSYIDIAFFNRHLFTLINRPVTYGSRRKDVRLVDTTTKLDRLVADNLRNAMRKKLTIPELLYQIRPPCSDSIIDLITEFDMSTTEQTNWFLMVRELPYLRYTLILGKKGVNSRYINSIKRSMLSMERSQVLRKLPEQSYLHIMGKFYQPVIELLEGG